MTQHQAYESAQAGRVVVGKSPRGEIQIAKSTILVGERRPQQKCEPEYDSYSGEYETKCKTVYELERVPKTVYFTSGPPGEVTRQFDNVAGAFAYAGRMGATTAWRLHQ